MEEHHAVEVELLNLVGTKREFDQSSNFSKTTRASSRCPSSNKRIRVSDDSYFVGSFVKRHQQPFVVLTKKDSVDTKSTALWNRVYDQVIPRCGARPCSLLLYREMGLDVQTWINKMLKFDWSKWMPKSDPKKLHAQQPMVPFNPTDERMTFRFADKIKKYSSRSWFMQ